MADALIALGGNIGDVRASFRRAIAEICERAAARLVARSADYRTPPWGDAAQPDFVNACIRIETPVVPPERFQAKWKPVRVKKTRQIKKLEPGFDFIKAGNALALLDVLQAVEAAFGRDRAAGRRWGPRTLDLDLLAYDDLTLHDPRLELPHPRLFERAFVLVPLCDIAPDRPIGGRTPADALKLISREGIEQLPDL